MPVAGPGPLGARGTLPVPTSSLLVSSGSPPSPRIGEALLLSLSPRPGTRTYCYQRARERELGASAVPAEGPGGCGSPATGRRGHSGRPAGLLLEGGDTELSLRDPFPAPVLPAAPASPAGSAPSPARGLPPGSPFPGSPRGSPAGRRRPLVCCVPARLPGASPGLGAASASGCIPWRKRGPCPFGGMGGKPQDGVCPAFHRKEREEEGKTRPAPRPPRLLSSVPAPFSLPLPPAPPALPAPPRAPSDGRSAGKRVQEQRAPGPAGAEPARGRLHLPFSPKVGGKGGKGSQNPDGKKTSEQKGTALPKPRKARKPAARVSTEGAWELTRPRGPGPRSPSAAPRVLCAPPSAAGITWLCVERRVHGPGLEVCAPPSPRAPRGRAAAAARAPPGAAAPSARRPGLAIQGGQRPAPRPHGGQRRTAQPTGGHSARRRPLRAA